MFNRALTPTPGHSFIMALFCIFILLYEFFMNVLHWEELLKKIACQLRELFWMPLVQTITDASAQEKSRSIPMAASVSLYSAQTEHKQMYVCIQKQLIGFTYLLFNSIACLHSNIRIYMYSHRKLKRPF